MKKKLLALIVASVGLFSVAQAKFYLGIEGGYTTQGLPGVQEKGKGIEFYTISTSGLGDLIKHGAKGYSIGAVLGTESFFGQYFGMRWGLGLGYSSTSKDLENNGKKEEQKLNAFASDLSIDMMVNFVNTGRFSFGVFGGVGAEYQLFVDSGKPKFHALGFEGRVGLTTLLGGHHRMEVFAKLPFADMSSKYSSGDDNLFAFGASKATFGASYKFVF